MSLTKHIKRTWAKELKSAEIRFLSGTAYTKKALVYLTLRKCTVEKVAELPR